MFFDIFKLLCEKKGVSPKKATEDIGLSNSITTKWKKTGATPKGDTLQRIADYFGVTTDYLLTGEETKKAPTQEGEREIGFDDFTYAFYEESKDLPDEKKKMLLEMARFMKADIEKEKG
ncbi:helix-turn-helix domain-containing protein [Flavonifractor plautii]|uniref:helix-turn-helix domain-containing protein n=1 Tax=Flavonifractor plautii TaxID=292800 RepID=UPI00214B3E0E|nr:helix-turn-helix transcriptional regulator [Flavonifractor plautii]MCR1907490.1 helix-turn-helix transcriptional regulator [Flavonifractor plautii]